MFIYEFWCWIVTLLLPFSVRCPDYHVVFGILVKNRGRSATKRCVQLPSEMTPHAIDAAHPSDPIHCCDVIMGAMASQSTSLTIVYSSVYSGADQIKHQSSASLARKRGIHRWPVISPHKWPVTPKMVPFDDVIMNIPPVRLISNCKARIIPTAVGSIHNPHQNNCQHGFLIWIRFAILASLTEAVVVPNLAWMCIKLHNFQINIKSFELEIDSANICI